MNQMKMKRMLAAILCLAAISLCFLSSAQETKKSDAQKPVIEERGVWLNRSEMFQPKEKISMFIEKISNAHLTTVYLNAYFKGGVVYPDSKFVPQVAEAKKIDFDAEKFIIDECHKKGIRVEAWVEYGFYCYHTDNATTDTSKGAILNKYPELAAIDIDGKNYLHNKDWGDFYSLCPANPKSHQIMTDIFYEIMTKHNYDGLNLDRIRFPEKNFCYCDYCKKQFKADCGIDLKNYPNKSPEEEKVLVWREKQLNQFMQSMSEKIRSIKPGMIITSAVVPVEMKRDKGQDWFTWMKMGYVDAVCPMLYTDSEFDNNIKVISENLGNLKGVFAGVNADNNPPRVVIKQIEKSRFAKMGGIVLWYSGKIDDDLPMLKEKYFREKSSSPFPLIVKK